MSPSVGSPKSKAIWGHHRTQQRHAERAAQSSLSVPSEHILWVLGASSFDEALKKPENFKLAGMAEEVQCPYLLTHGELDAQIPIDDARALFDAIGTKDKALNIFTLEEGGFEHCQGGNLTPEITYIADWLAERSSHAGLTPAGEDRSPGQQQPAPGRGAIHSRLQADVGHRPAEQERLALAVGAPKRAQPRPQGATNTV